MSRQKTKSDLLQDIQTERRRLEHTLAGLTKRDMTRRGVVGEWSIKDVLAHLTAWEQLFAGWYKAGLRDSQLKRTPVGMSTAAIASLNERIYTENQHRPLDEVLLDFKRSYRRILNLVQTIPEEDLFAHNRFAWTGNLTLADYVAGNTCNHYRWAKTQIQKWLKNRPEAGRLASRIRQRER